MHTPHLDLQTSKLYLTLVSFLHFIAILSILFSSMPILLKVIISIICFTSWIFILHRYVLMLSTKSIVSAKLEKDLSWILVDKLGRAELATLQKNSLCTRWLVILNFKYVNRFFEVPLVIFPDSITKENFRRLHVYLYLVRNKFTSV